MKVAEFRQAVEHLDRMVRVDHPACVGKFELEEWAKRARHVINEVAALRCARATDADWQEQRESLELARRVLERS